MSNTAWFLEDLDTSLVARPYRYSGGMYFDNGLYGFPWYPAGQLRTTLASLARFMIANMKWGELEGSRILDSATIRMIRTAHVSIELDETYQVGLMWLKETYTGEGLWGHIGDASGVGTAMFLSEADSTGIIFMANTGWVSSMGTGIVNRLIDEARIFVGVRDAPTQVPERFQLYQNFPNPFNPSTSIQYTVAGARDQGSGISDVKLTVYDLLGREVALLVNEKRPAGTYTVHFDGSGLASGSYIYRLQADGFVQSRQFLLLK
jgi:CubicO group peptidase (beta-lactamase class C family)